MQLILIHYDLCFRFLRNPTSQYLYYSKTVKRMLGNSRQK